MDCVTIKRPITVKVKVTEGYKKKVALEVQETIRRLELELQHLEFHGKRMLANLEKQNPNGILKAKDHLQTERQKRLSTKEKLSENLKQIAQLANGSEVLHDTLESIVEVRIGDDWNKIMGTEILICDEKVVEIRTAYAKVD